MQPAKASLRCKVVHPSAGLSHVFGCNGRCCHPVTQVLAAFLKAIGCIIPLMDAMYASYYTREVMLVLVREFQTPDEEMKKIVLKVGRGPALPAAPMR